MGRDGQDQQLYILQARPETVKSQEESADRLRRYRLKHAKNYFLDLSARVKRRSISAIAFQE